MFFLLTLLYLTHFIQSNAFRKTSNITMETASATTTSHTTSSNTTPFPYSTPSNKPKSTKDCICPPKRRRRIRRLQRILTSQQETNNNNSTITTTARYLPYLNEFNKDIEKQSKNNKTNSTQNHDIDSDEDEQDTSNKLNSTLSDSDSDSTNKNISRNYESSESNDSSDDNCICNKSTTIKPIIVCWDNQIANIKCKNDFDCQTAQICDYNLGGYCCTESSPWAGVNRLKDLSFTERMAYYYTENTGTFIMIIIGLSLAILGLLVGIVILLKKLKNKNSYQKVDIDNVNNKEIDVTRISVSKHELKVNENDIDDEDDEEDVDELDDIIRGNEIKTKNGNNVETETRNEDPQQMIAGNSDIGKPEHTPSHERNV